MDFNLTLRFKWLWFILGGAFLVRFAALTFGLPLNLSGDEFAHVIASFSYLEDMTLRMLNPLVYTPSLLGILITPFVALWGVLLMLTGAVDGIAGFKEYAILNAVYFIPIGRAISALLGTLFVYMIFLITRRITNEKIALLAAALAAVDFWLVHESQFAHFWMPSVALIAVVFYMLIRLVETGAFKYWRESIAALVLAFWMGYFPVVLAPFLALAHWHSPERWNLKRLWYGGGALVALTALVGWLNPLSFLKQFGRAIKTALEPLGINVFPQYNEAATVPTEPIANLLLFLKLLILDNPLIFVLGMFGMGLMVWRCGCRNFYTQLTVGFFFAYLVAAMFIWSHPDNRYILPLLLPLYIGVAYSMYIAWEYVSSWRDARYVAIVLVAAAGLYSAYATFSYSFLLQKDDTRLLAREWVMENVPAEATILTDAEYLELPRSPAAIYYLEKYLPEALRSRDRIVAELPKHRLQSKAYFSVNTEYAQKLAEKNALPMFSYIVIGFYNTADKPSIPREQYELVASWYPRNSSESIDELIANPNNPLFAAHAVSYLGPHIEIYRRLE